MNDPHDHPPDDPRDDSAEGVFERMQDMIDALQDAQSELDIEVAGTAGGGAVRVRASVSADGLPEIRRVELSEEALEDREMLEDLIAAAVNDAIRMAREEIEERLGDLYGVFQGQGFEDQAAQAVQDMLGNLVGALGGQGGEQGGLDALFRGLIAPDAGEEDEEDEEDEEEREDS